MVHIQELGLEMHLHLRVGEKSFFEVFGVDNKITEALPRHLTFFITYWLRAYQSYVNKDLYALFDDFFINGFSITILLDLGENSFNDSWL